MRMKAPLSCVSAAALLLVTSVSVAAQRDVCKVTTYWVERGVGSTSRFNVGDPFAVAVADEQVGKSFTHAESGLTVRVGVEYFDTPRRVRLALALAGDPAAGVFEETERAEAETFHSRDWRGMSVSRSIRVGAREYTYTFDCVSEKYGGRLLKKRAKP